MHTSDASLLTDRQPTPGTCHVGSKNTRIANILWFASNQQERKHYAPSFTVSCTRTRAFSVFDDLCRRTTCRSSLHPSAPATEYPSLPVRGTQNSIPGQSQHIHRTTDQ